MDSSKNDTPIRAWGSGEAQTRGRINVYRYDLFKGVADPAGKIMKVRSIGTASIRDGLSTYVIELKTLGGLRFYLLPSNKERTNGADHLIFTREDSRRSDKKYFWSIVGEGWVLKGANDSLMRLKWDLFGEEVYMNLKPFKVIEVSESSSLSTA